jgi:hypothetical protein
VVGVENELVCGHDGGCNGQLLVVMARVERKTQVAVVALNISLDVLLYISPTLDEENPRAVASSMANGAIRRDPIAVKGHDF